MPSKSTASAKSAKSAGPASPARSGAVKLLTEDHQEVRALFKAFDQLRQDEAADGADKEALALQICTLLTVHTQIEEEIFYPAAREALDTQDLLDEACVEHASVKALIAQIESMSADEPLFDARVTVLAEYVEHHVKEEEGELFPKLKKSALDLAALGAQMNRRKQALLAGADVEAGIEADGDA